MSPNPFPKIGEKEITRWEETIRKHCKVKEGQKAFLTLEEMPKIDLTRIDDPYIKKHMFLVAYIKIGEVHAACIYANINRQTPYRWMGKDPEYKRAYQDARAYVKDVKVQAIEDKLYRDYVDGYDKSIIHQGEVTGTHKEYSLGAAKIFLEGNAPEKYKQRIDVTAKTGPSSDPKDYTDAELAEMLPVKKEDKSK